MFSGESDPPRFSGTMWSTTYPGHGPTIDCVAGHGCSAWNACRALELRRIRPLGVRSHVTQWVELCRTPVLASGEPSQAAGRWVRRVCGRPWSRLALRGSERAYRCETLAGATAADSMASVPIRNRSEVMPEQDARDRPAGWRRGVVGRCPPFRADDRAAAIEIFDARNGLWTIITSVADPRLDQFPSAQGSV